MRLKAFFVLTSASLFFFSSCIKDEAPNLEADIISFGFEEIDDLAAPAKSSDVIVIELTDTLVDLKSLTPIIKITDGAIVSPESGIKQNFSDTVKYTVTSESGTWKRIYKVAVKKMLPMNYSFEEWQTQGTLKYPALTDAQWSTANAGIALAQIGQANINYPTQSTEDAHDGKYAAKLETQLGGTYFNNLIPIFAGSLFRGQFGPIDMSNFAKSAKFGQPHLKGKGKPVRFKGYYKYTPGSVYYNEKDEVVAGKTDELAIYSVLYKVTKGTNGVAGKEEFLDGTNVLTSDKVIAKAELLDKTPKTVYTEFNLLFNYKEEPDYDRFDYKLAVVFSSSKDGDFYRGAVGSCLIVDEVEIVCEAYE